MLFRKLTEERSGNFSAASPPPASSAGCASAQVVVTNSKVARATDALAIPRLADAKQAVQVRITILLRISIQGSQRVHFPWWMASAGRFLEGPAARLVYRRHACVAVSASTVAAMRRRLRWKGDIYLIPNGVPKAEKVRSFLRVPNFPNTSTRNPRNLVWVGRLVAHKRAELLLPLAVRLRLRLRNDRLVIDVVGRGPAEGPLAAKVAAYSLERTVRLRGFLPEADKQALVAGSLLHLNTSQGEGWGLCVLEAALIDAGAAVRRPATPLERLTGAGQPPRSACPRTGHPD